MTNELSPALQLLQRLWRLNHALERRSQEMEGRMGITAQQRFLIRCIGRFPGISPSEVANILHVDPATVSVAVRKLEAKGLVERARDLSDSRRVILGLTSEGKQFDRPAPLTVESGVEQFLTAHPKEQTEAFARALDALATAVEDDGVRRATPRLRARAGR